MSFAFHRPTTSAQVVPNATWIVAPIATRPTKTVRSVHESVKAASATANGATNFRAGTSVTGEKTPRIPPEPMSRFGDALDRRLCEVPNNMHDNFHVKGPAHFAVPETKMAPC